MFHVLKKIYFEDHRTAGWAVSLMFAEIMLLIPSVILPIFYNQIVDQAIAKGEMGEFIYCICGICGLFIIKIVFCWVKIRTDEMHKCAFGRRLGEKLWEKYYSVYHCYNLGEAEQIFDQDLMRIGDFISKYIVGNIVNILCVSVLFTVLLWENWILTVSVGILIPPVMLLVKKLSVKNRIIRERTAEKEAEIYYFLEKMFSSMTFLKMMREEAYVERIYKKSLSDVVKNKNKGLAMGLALESTNYLFENFLCKLLIYLLGSYLILQGTVTIGTVILFAEYGAQIFQRLGNITQSILDFSGEKKFFERILNLLTAEGKEKGSFSWRNMISVYLNGKKEINIRKGNFTGIIGASGSGKTTIIRYILGKQKNSMVTVTYDGIPLERLLENRKLPEDMVSINNQSYIFEGTVLQNLRYICSLREQEIENLAELFHVDRVFFYKRTGKNGSALSGGEKQILLLMRGMLKNPDTLILDEVTSALDSEKRVIAKKMLESVWKGKTRIVITHDISLIENADEIYCVEKNKIIPIDRYTKNQGMSLEEHSEEG